VLPDVRTAPVSGQTPQSVTLNGTVDPDGAGEASCQFDWGSTPALGKVAPCSQAVPNGEGAVAVHASIGGFERDTTYYYRLQASNTNGTNYGEPAETQQFTTTGAAIHAAFATNISATSATFGARIDPGSTPTSYYFQYGPSAAYGAESPAAPGASLGAGRGAIEAPAIHVQQLTPGSVYHYRVVALSEAQPGQIETLYSEDHTFTTQVAGGSFTLPDGRQWQLVSPADKLGALIEPHQSGGVIQAAADGNAIAYRASSPTEHAAQGFAREVTVLSTRSASGWSSQDISEPNLSSVYPRGSIGKEFQIFSEDLSHAAIQPIESVFTPLSPEASETTPYLRTDYLNGDVGEHCQSGCYRALVTGKAGFANVPADTVFGEEPEGFCELDLCGPKFQGASADLSHMVISSPAQLTKTPAPAGGPGLYEWSDGSLQLLDLLPSGEEGPAVLAGVSRDTEGHERLGVRNSISADGARVILEGGAEGGHGLYLRDTAAGQTIRLDVPQGGSGPSEDVSYVNASPDASRIFFLDSGRLMADSSPGGEDLYEYDLQAPAGSRLSDLSAASPGQSADVSALLGIGGDGSYVYFAAGGALAPGAVAGQCPQAEYEVEPQSPGCNLYVRHDGATRLVAVLPSEDVYAWSRGLADFGQASYGRVAGSGQWFAFLSNGELTGYDSHDATSGQPDIEVYVYDASTDEVACASCDPTGARPAGSQFEEFGGSLKGWVAARLPAWTEPPTNFGSLAAHQPRYLSDSGRLSFDSTDALVPQDVDGVEDVYEWEPVGVGSCTTAGATFSAGSQSCVNLISSGTSPEASEFIDASETGGDVFFRTRAQLASQDYDTAYDVYDAHECTSAVPCLPVMTPPPACSTETSCKAPPTPQPALFGVPASATFSGTGNLASHAAPTAKPKSTKPKSKSKAKSKPRAKSKRRSAKCGKPSTKRKCTRSPRAAQHPQHKDTRTGRHASGARR
jgi:hypothetical protein